MKRIFMIAFLVGGLVGTVSLIGSAQEQDAQDSTGLSDRIWKRGLKIAPVTLNLDGKNKKRVGMGSYIVNAQAACVSCHKSPTYADGGDPASGQPEQINQARYLAGGEHFGPFTSSNITPDANGLPAGLTLDQFIQVMRTGFDADKHPQFGPFLQVMPWPAYSKMTDEDLRNIYEYLRAVPHAESLP